MIAIMPISVQALRKSPWIHAALLAALYLGSDLAPDRAGIRSPLHPSAWAKKTPAAKPAAPPDAPPPADVIPVKARDIYDMTQKLLGESMRGRTPGGASEPEARAFLAQAMLDTKLQPPSGTAAPPPAPAPAAPPPAAAGAGAGDGDGDRAADVGSEADPAEGPAPRRAGLVAVSPQAAPFLQPVPVVSVRTRLLPGGVPSFRSTAGTVATKSAAGLNDVLLWPGEAGASIAVRESAVAFVGYGIVAPEYKWDDYAGLDVAGKTVIILDGEPASDPKAFAGKAASPHSRWPAKFATAAKKGAVAALIILDGGDANVPGSPLSILRATRAPGSDFILDRDPSIPDGGNLKVRGFITRDVVRRSFESARIDLDDLAKSAERRGFTGGTLKLSMTTQFTCSVRKLDAYNIVGVLPGSDPARASEAIVYTAHWDGASPLESAAGVATLLAMAKSAASRGPLPRTQIFAALSPQTEHFLGARALLARLPAPATKVIAHINLDGVNPLATDETVTQIGRGRSTLDAVLDAAAKEQERRVVDDPQPELGLYYRSESWAFAQAGIPSLFLGWADQRRYLREEYRQRERFGATWSFVGAAADGELLLDVGRRLADLKPGPAALPHEKKPGSLLQ